MEREGNECQSGPSRRIRIGIVGRGDGNHPSGGNNRAETKRIIVGLWHEAPPSCPPLQLGQSSRLHPSGDKQDIHPARIREWRRNEFCGGDCACGIDGEAREDME